MRAPLHAANPVDEADWGKKLARNSLHAQRVRESAKRGFRGRVGIRVESGLRLKAVPTCLADYVALQGFSALKFQSSRCKVYLKAELRSPKPKSLPRSPLQNDGTREDVWHLPLA